MNKYHQVFLMSIPLILAVIWLVILSSPLTSVDELPAPPVASGLTYTLGLFVAVWSIVIGIYLRNMN